MGLFWAPADAGAAEQKKRAEDPLGFWTERIIEAWDSERDE